MAFLRLCVCERLSVLKSLSIAFLLPLILMGCLTTATQTEQPAPVVAKKVQLSWPVEGEVSEPFGTTVNPVYGTKSYNPGIVIATRSYADVKAVYDGQVTEVYIMPEFGRVVTVNHGDFVSLYGNLSSTDVSEGMPVMQGQVIGMAGTAEEPKGEAIFFAVFEDGVESNPEPWFASGGVDLGVMEPPARTKPKKSGSTMKW